MVFKYTPGIQNIKKDVGEEIITYSLALIFLHNELCHTCLYTQYMTVSPHLIPVPLGLPQFFLLLFLHLSLCSFLLFPSALTQSPSDANPYNYISLHQESTY